MTSKPEPYSTSRMEWLEESWQRQGEEIAALHEEARKRRAEIERLSGLVAAHWKTIMAKADEIDWLHAENERLRAEVERVYSERNDAVDELVLLRDERTAALAEIGRLRAAAQRILDALDEGVPTQEEIEAFREALAGHME